MRAASGGSGRVLADPTATRVRWGDLRLRVISASVVAPVALACLWFGGWPWTVLMVVVSALLVDEWTKLVGATLSRPVRVVGAVLLTAVSLGFVWLRADPACGLRNVLFVVVVVWSADIGAYCVGRLVGGPKLAPSISPGKTWSGAVGGTLASVVGGLCVSGWRDGVAGPVAVGLLLSVASQVGDLAESALKRRVGVKDSGTLMPGHGGLLDRLDGMLLAGLVAMFLAGFLGRGVELWR